MWYIPFSGFDDPCGMLSLCRTRDCYFHFHAATHFSWTFSQWHFYKIILAYYDSQDSPDPLANSLLQPQLPGTLVLELDWLPLRTDKDEPLVLCIAGADSSFRLIEVNMYVACFLLFPVIFHFALGDSSSIAYGKYGRNHH